ncbi:MAG: lipoyl domain-containing protein, partial [Armatimonadetes bacterium]|nr:lipoyl domain-containing protein [Armatimonadota bacterium]
MTEQAPVLVPRETVNDDSVRLVALHVEDGAAVAEGQPICEIETSKAAVEIEAPQAGFVRFAAAVG